MQVNGALHTIEKSRVIKNASQLKLVHMYHLYTMGELFVQKTHKNLCTHTRKTPTHTHTLVYT